METDAEAPRRWAWEPQDADVRRYIRWAGGAGALATALWLWLQLDLLDGRVFGNFYDLQARALLDGHLDVPAGSLGNEAFAVRGQEFLYNPPGPSLLRMPLFLVTDRFDGRLTVLSMLLAWLVTLTVLALLIWRVRRILRGTATLPRWEATGYGALIIAATLGTTLVYLGAIPWVFHEAYAWAVPMALGSAYALTGLIERPSIGRAVTTGLFTLGAILCRTTAGWACVAAVLVTAAWFFRGGRGASGRRLWWKVSLAGALPVLIGVAINWAKFRHPWAFPLQNQVFTTLSESRRQTLAATGGDGFSPKVVFSTLPAYLRPDGLHLSSIFPYLSLPAEPAATHGGVTFDRTYRTGSITAFMPLLLGLAVWGTVTAFRRRGPTGAVVLRLPLLGVALIPGAVVFGAYITHRYTAEFLPFLLFGSVVGAIALSPTVAALDLTRRRLALSGLAAAALFGVLANLAVAMTLQAQANPGPVLQSFVDRQARFSSWTGEPLDDHVVASVQLPTDGPTDELRIIGECQALYVGTGERYEPWVEVGNRSLRVDFTPAPVESGVPSDPLVLAEFVGHHRSRLLLERAGADAFRLSLTGGGQSLRTAWVEVTPGSIARIEVSAEDPGDYVVSGPGEMSIRVPKESLDAAFVSLPNVLVPAPLNPSGLSAVGLSVLPQPTPVLTTCDRLRERYLEGLGTS